MSQRRAIEEFVPAGDDFSRIPFFSFAGIDVQYNMVVVRRSVQEVLIQRVHGCTGAGDGVSTYIQSEDLGEFQNTGLYPASAVFIINACMLIPPT